MTVDLPNDLLGALADRYDFERLIGRGGMASVYLAIDRKHHRQVAIKVLPPRIDEASLDRFLREVETVARLSHPHILALHDSGVVGDKAWFVMPYVKGGSLRDRLDREGRLPVEESVALVRRLAFALSYAHGQGVVHRDLKPENILLQEGEPVLVDFGVAFATAPSAGPRLTGTGISVGTVDYMSPEQSLGDEVDARSDVYSLACVLYELLAGEVPFKAPSSMAVVAKRMSMAPPSVRALRPEVSRVVDVAIMSAMARDPSARTPSTAVFAERLAAPDESKPERPRVAVLPFLNLSADADNEYFADGVTEEVILHLSRLRNLSVIARGSVMSFKERSRGIRDIASTLNATALVDGSVRRAASRVRIVAQLIDARTEQPLWSESYDRELADIFAIQGDVARNIAGALSATLTPTEETRLDARPTANLDAWELYLRGRYYMTRFTRAGMEQANKLFDQAIAVDPGFALAHAQLAQVLIEMGEGGYADPAVMYARARTLVMRAVELDPHGGTYASLGYYYLVADHDWAAAERAFRDALDIQPRNADALDHYGRLCAAMGRVEEALDLQLRAYEVDPLVHRTDVITAHIRAGRNEQALELALRLIEEDPTYDRAHATLGWALHRCGRPEEGVAALRRAQMLSPDAAQWLAQLGQMLGMLGHVEEAREILARMHGMARDGYVSPYHFAFVHTGLGEYDAAVDWLERAYQAKAGAVYGIRGSFLLEPLRTHPRFIELLRRLKLA